MITLSHSHQIEFGPFGGAELFFADIDGDGEVEILAYQGPGVFGAAMYAHLPQVAAGRPERTCLSAFKKDGSRLWTFGEPNPPDKPYICHAHEACVAAGDANDAAAAEVALADGDVIYLLEGAARNLAAFPGEKGWVLRPNANHNAGGPDVPTTAAPAFMRHVLAGGPGVPEVTNFRVSADGARYSWRASGPRPIREAVLYWSPGEAVSSARYWIGFPAECKGGVWTAAVPPAFAALASQAFVNVRDAAGDVVSSRLLRHDGLNPMLQPGLQWPGGQLWDVERGAAAWRPRFPWTPMPTIETTGAGAVRIVPDKNKSGGKFTLLTNSVILASGVASKHKGVRVRIDGNGHAGKLTVSLLRDTNSLDERVYCAEIAYSAGISEHELPWSAFKLTTRNVVDSPSPLPFDGLLIEGTRPSGAPVTLTAVTFLDD